MSWGQKKKKLALRKKCNGFFGAYLQANACYFYSFSLPTCISLAMNVFSWYLYNILYTIYILLILILIFLMTSFPTRHVYDFTIFAKREKFREFCTDYCKQVQTIFCDLYIINVYIYSITPHQCKRTNNTLPSVFLFPANLSLTWTEHIVTLIRDLSDGSYHARACVFVVSFFALQTKTLPGYASTREIRNMCLNGRNEKKNKKTKNTKNNNTVRSEWFRVFTAVAAAP